MALLATKLTPPRTPLRQVFRPRLIDLLNAGTQQLLTLLSAPAGAGKTALLASWSSAGQPPGPLAWVSLDAGDNEADRFWAHALAALCRSGAVPSDSPLRTLGPASDSSDGFLPRLVSGLAELPTPVVLVLDSGGWGHGGGDGGGHSDQRQGQRQHGQRPVGLAHGVLLS